MLYLLARLFLWFFLWSCIDAHKWISAIKLALWTESIRTGLFCPNFIKIFPTRIVALVSVFLTSMQLRSGVFDTLSYRLPRLLFNIELMTLLTDFTIQLRVERLLIPLACQNLTSWSHTWTFLRHNIELALLKSFCIVNHLLVIKHSLTVVITRSRLPLLHLLNNIKDRFPCALRKLDWLGLFLDWQFCLFLDWIIWPWPRQNIPFITLW